MEIYEYQNFFLLKKHDGEMVLLDGFRRLIWYNAPNMVVNVRVYRQDELTDSQILELLVNLNHFKFYGGGSYQDRGFALLLRVIFNLNIYKYRDAFDGYLFRNKTKSDYGGYEKADGVEIKSRIVNPMFVSDVTFMEELVDSACTMVNKFFGTLLYQYRISNPEKVFSSAEFLRLQSANKVIIPLIGKYEAVGDCRSSKSMEIVNQIMEIYENIFSVMVGGEVEKSYAELYKECKDLSSEIAKDKKYTKLTGSTITYVIENIMREMLKNEVPLSFKCVVYPVDYKMPIKVACGLREDVTVLGAERAHFLDGGGMGIVLGLWEDKNKFVVRHNYRGKKYTKMSSGSIPESTYDIDLYVNIPKAESKLAENKRLNRS